MALDPFVGVVPSRVLLVRHGETDWNREGRLQGWAPVPLTEHGREQARELGAVLAAEYSIDRLIASDLTRTRETAALLREAGIEAEPTFDSGWRERDLGVMQGFHFKCVDERFPIYSPDAGVASIEERPPGGESIVDCHARVVAAWEDLVANLQEETALVVTHGGPVRGVIAHLGELDLLAAMTDLEVTNCAITAVVIDGDASVRCLAESPDEFFT